MKSPFIVHVAATLLAYFSMGAQSYSDSFVDGNTLLSFCEVSPHNASGYILGVVDANTSIKFDVLNNGNLQWRPKKICIPSGVTGGQLVDIACSYIKNTPEDRHWPASMLVYTSVHKSFPCQ